MVKISSRGIVEESNDVNRNDEEETGKRQKLDHLLEELVKRAVVMLTEVKEHIYMHRGELSDKVV
jgi:hypothetical protein